MKKTILYTDGSCSNNPGPGGWGCVIIENGKESYISGSESDTTNNRMEMSAAIFGIKTIIKKGIKEIELITDSTYVKNGITIWIKDWKKSNWKNGKIKNVDLWQELDILNQTINITWKWTRGHSGNKHNEKADELARNAIIF